MVQSVRATTCSLRQRGLARVFQKVIGREMPSMKEEIVNDSWREM